ncbi:hypothetical protein [Nostocoides sp. Soil756]|uniref:hypothetical protein n=1 Tax=Nostocoides sp. Soil756 TaxID=1736399 RepID=UPI0007003624|nr:hypothetical protein [Tetrasphaera sp. Soil756]KRE61289.1 hypothetical protein ASG78_13275 [Tetrasphaera sp. Soil756]
MEAGWWPLVFLVLPGVVYIAGFSALDWMCGGETPRSVRWLRRRLGPALRRRWGHHSAAVLGALERVGVVTRRRDDPVPAVLLSLELRRLAYEVRRIDGDQQPHRAARLAAALAAYDHVLVQLCTHAEVPTPIGLLPLDPRDRLGLEADLVASGLDW